MTPSIHLHILASGSKGNAAVVEGPQGCVLVDCGLSRKRLLSCADELGVDMSRVQAVLFTHEHADHVAGASVFCRRFEGELMATAGTIAARKYLTELPFAIIGNDDAFDLCGMRVTTFSTSHDVADPIGFRFEAADDALGYCTDTGVLLPRARKALRGCRILAIESNHDERMLATGPYPRFLKERVGGRLGHLSNRQCAEALAELVTDDTETVVGMHLSEKNNRPSVARRTLEEAVGNAADVLVAAQERPLSVW